MASSVFAAADSARRPSRAVLGVVVGGAQALALVPGVSRSGATTTMGLALGYTRPAAAEVTAAVDAAEHELGDEGRVLLRPSGTEQLVRVMVEAADTDTAERLAGRIAERVAAVGR